MLRWQPNPVPYGPGSAARRRPPSFSLSPRAQGARVDGQSFTPYPLPGTRSVRGALAPIGPPGPGSAQHTAPTGVFTQSTQKRTLNYKTSQPKRTASNSFNAALFGTFSGSRESTRSPRLPIISSCSPQPASASFPPARPSARRRPSDSASCRPPRSRADSSARWCPEPGNPASAPQPCWPRC